MLEPWPNRLWIRRCFLDQFHFTLCILITAGTGVYLLSDSPKANDIMELRSIGQV
ncbi:MAG: hypothetical protein J7K51_03780 [Thermotogae bacterium]|nr:hypothetical protein [Thermotogota bacterium]